MGGSGAEEPGRTGEAASRGVGGAREVLFDRKEDVAHVAQSMSMEKIAENDYNLSVSSYVEAKDTREVINIIELNQQIETTVSKIDGLHKDIDSIVAEIKRG